MTITEDLFLHHAKQFGAASIEHIAVKLAEEVGELCGAVVRQNERRAGRDWKAEIETELRDVLVVFYVFCGAIDLDFDAWLDNAKPVARKNPILAVVATVGDLVRYPASGRVVACCESLRHFADSYGFDLDATAAAAAVTFTGRRWPDIKPLPWLIPNPVDELPGGECCRIAAGDFCDWHNRDNWHAVVDSKNGEHVPLWQLDLSARDGSDQVLFPRAVAIEDAYDFQRVAK